MGVRQQIPCHSFGGIVGYKFVPGLLCQVTSESPNLLAISLAAACCKCSIPQDWESIWWARAKGRASVTACERCCCGLRSFWTDLSIEEVHVYKSLMHQYLIQTKRCRQKKQVWFKPESDNTCVSHSAGLFKSSVYFLESNFHVFLQRLSLFFVNFILPFLLRNNVSSNSIKLSGILDLPPNQ